MGSFTLALYSDPILLRAYNCYDAQQVRRDRIVKNKWQPIDIKEEGGLLRERVSLWRNHRLWYIAESGYLIDGFENRPGVHPWQGEHLGKWLHAAVLAWRITGDIKLQKEMESNVKRLLATQLPDGYLGTYDDESTFMAMPESRGHYLQDDVAKLRFKSGWDIWTHRYNLYGLLTYERYFPNERIIDACKKMADLLISVYSEAGHDITRYGTREGISSTTLLESIMMLFERTGEKAYLEFAEHIVATIENNPAHRLMGTMLDDGSVVHPGNGKGYQLMANLIGFLRLYQCTEDERYLQTVLKGWEKIQAKHILVTGGPWTRKMDYNANRECFAYTGAFNPEEISVEGCCDATWIQLNIHLFEFTGEARYMDEAEKTLINSLYGHQNDDGVRWCYFTKPNEEALFFDESFKCCASSMPRGMEMFSANLVGDMDGALCINGLSPFTAGLPDQFGGGSVTVESDFPFGSAEQDSTARITLHLSGTKEYILEFRVPLSVSLTGVQVNGIEVTPERNSRGFYEINRSWEKYDVIEINYVCQLGIHVQEGEDGRKWVAFTVGPLALAQKVPPDRKYQPVRIDADKPVDSNLVLHKSDSQTISYRITGTDIELMPYYQAGTDTTGTRAYFPV